MLTEIKEEPEDYEEMDMSCNIRSDEDIDNDVDDDDDDDEEEDEEEDDSDEDDDNEDDYEEDDDEEDDDESGRLSCNDKQEEIKKDNEPSDVCKIRLIIYSRESNEFLCPEVQQIRNDFCFSILIRCSAN